MSAQTIKGLTYPHSTPPGKGEWIETAPGVYWLQMALPMALDHINLYALDDDDGWWVVDTGMKWGDTRERWQRLFDGPMAGKPLKGVVCTHMHPDHIGQAGWLCREYQAPLYMSFGEYYSARALSQEEHTESDWRVVDHFTAAGVELEQVERMGRKFRGFGSIVEPLPRSYTRLSDGDELVIGGRQWQVLVGSGHSPEHVCLYNAEDKLLLSGDQIIPRITSNVSVMPQEPLGNPLKRWLDSLQYFLDQVHPDTLVMPAHNAPFYGVHTRLNALIEHHYGHLAAIEEACRQPHCARDLFPVLFAREIGDDQLAIALGESIAHLHYLYAEGRLGRERDAQGVLRYHSLDPDNCPYTRCSLTEEDVPMEV